VLGRDYVPATSIKRYRERGVASWYGRRFHGQKTSTGETYDMYKMTAAHPTLPLPSYARVTNVATGKSVIVRVNDRGPFLHERIIDLSYAAASRIGIAQNGSGLVEVEAIVPSDLVLADATPPLAPVSEPPTGATAPAPATEPELEPTKTLGGFAVQLGAFANYANAQNFLTRVSNQLATVPVEAKVRQMGGLFRVYVGPYVDRDEARRVADRLNVAFGLATTVAPH
jgi:rare lipoprotein A